MIRLFLVPILAFIINANVFAEKDISTRISPANSTSGSTQVRDHGGIYRISNGLKSRDELHLFHEFEHFDLGPEDKAQFENNLSGSIPKNIIARVTGDSVSNIFGTLSTSGFPGTNLFFINPSGVVFGPGSELDIDGSFHISNTQHIGFNTSDGEIFLRQGEDVSLITGPISSFGFIDNTNTQGISIHGTNEEHLELSTSSGHNLSIIGHNIKLQNVDLNAPEAALNIIGVDIGKHYLDKLPGTDFDSAGTVSMNSVNIGLKPRTDDVSPDKIQIAASQLQTENTLISSQRTRNGVGNIFLSAHDILLQDNFSISASTAFPESGGNITLIAKNSMRLQDSGLDNMPSIITSSTTGSGDAGEINIKSPFITLNGDISIRAFSARGGQSGNIKLFVDKFQMIGNTALDVRSIRSGTGGEIDFIGYDGMNPANSIKINSTQTSAINSQTNEGMGGSITISAEFIQLTHSNITAQAEEGLSGNIQIDASDLSLTDSSSINVTTKHSDAGTIQLTANRLLRLDDGSQITSSVGGGTGKGGDITIQSEFVILDNTSQITAEAINGPGGKIDINADFLLNAPNSSISARSQAGGNLSGVVTVTAPDENIVSSAQNLSDTYLDTPVLSASPCATRTGSNGNSLVIHDGSGIAPEPDSMLLASVAQLASLPPVRLESVGNTLALYELECSRNHYE